MMKKIQLNLYAILNGYILILDVRLVLKYLSIKLELIMPDEIKEILHQLDKVSIPTRYPEELTDLLKMFPDDKTQKILEQTRKTLQWLISQ